MIILTPNAKYKFFARNHSDFGCDEAVVKETWVENVYQIERGDLNDTGIFVDIGANIGSVSVHAASLNDENDDNPDLPEIKVFAVEPEPDNLEYLHKNINYNNLSETITICPVAVGAEKGSVLIENRQGNSRTGNTPDDLKSKEFSKVEMVTLEDLFRDYGITYCDVLKMDIEGAERQIIKQSDTDVLRKIKYLTLEFDPTTEDEFGEMVAKLAGIFNLHILGAPERGGYIYGRRY